MNRLISYFDPFSDDEEVPHDYYLIETEDNFFAVDRETADAVARQLDRCPAPRWIMFRDLSTALHRLRAEQVYRISESTAQQRAALRAFWRARRLEAKADRRSWEDDD